MKQITINSDPTLKVGFSEDTIEEFYQIATQRGIDKSELVRQWIRIGYRAEQNLIPEFEEKKETPSNSDNIGPIETLFEEELPDNEDDAVAIDELQDQIAERVNNRVIELFRESGVVNTSNGKLYKDA